MQRLRGGWYSTPPATALMLAEAAVRACSGSVLSHHSAALIHDLTVLGPAPGLPRLTLRPGNQTYVSGAHIHRATLDPVDVVDVNGIPATSVARTLVDLARHQPFRTGVVSIDAALNKQQVTEIDLFDVARRCWNWPGIRRALRAIAARDSRAESPLESISRLTLAWLGLPPPEPQLVVRDGTGRFIARVDFGWRGFGVVGECDGLSKYTDPGALRAEKVRQESLEQLGLVVVRWTWADATRQPFQLKARIEQAFDRAVQFYRAGLVVKASLSAA